MSDPRTLTGYNCAGEDPIDQSDPSGYSFLDDLGVGDVVGGATTAAGVAAFCGATVGVGCVAGVAAPSSAGGARGGCIDASMENRDPSASKFAAGSLSNVVGTGFAGGIVMGVRAVKGG
jgi:hypothetical protein